MKKEIFVIITLLLVVATACELNQNNNLGNTGNSQTNNSGSSNLQATGELKKFSSDQDIMDFLDKSQAANSYGMTRNYVPAMEQASGLMTDKTASAGAVQSPAPSSNGASATDFSHTNVQVAGVDEADFMKNDGKYIYVISGAKLVIVNAYPADNATIVSKTDIEGYAQDMFVNKDTLVLFVEKNDQDYTFEQYDIIPRPVYKQSVHAMVYDISDRADPKLVKDYDTKGNYVTSRMIGDYVYVIAQDSVYYYNRVLDMPAIRESSKLVVRPDVYYFDMPDTNYNFNTVMSLNLNDDSVQAKTFMMGYSNVIYVSENNIYISYQKTQSYTYYQQYNQDRFYNVVVPLLSSNIQTSINSIKNDNALNAYEKWDKISSVLEDMYNKMDDTEKQDMVDKMQQAIDDYELKQEEESRRTVIHKIKIDNGNLDYVGKGEVKGYLLNQYSMDENNDKLRVATTFDAWSGSESILYNNVYVLDSGMNVVGSLEKIAPDESIYSTRFIGDKLYMVTFQRVDPFFVIDLSGTDPIVLGKLSIPGYSDYLHPYDETHIIGLGKVTGENDWGGISTKGIQLAMFDVSDVANPKKIDTYTIGDAGTDSEALNDPKAFLFDKDKNLLVIPARVVSGKQIYDPNLGYYRQSVWQGAYVFTVTETGFTLKGKIGQYQGDENYGWWYGSPDAVRRSLFMDNVLYTVSNKKILANSLDDLSKISEVKLPYTVYYPYPIPYYKNGGGPIAVDAGVASGGIAETAVASGGSAGSTTPAPGTS